MFIVIHLRHLRFPRPPYGEELSTLHFVLYSQSNLIIYLLGSLALFFHLFHGIESSQRSLGLLTSENASLIRIFGRSLSIIISIGFIVVTILISEKFIIG